jgi:hypothetical protein
VDVALFATCGGVTRNAGTPFKKEKLKDMRTIIIFPSILLYFITYVITDVNFTYADGFFKLNPGNVITEQITISASKFKDTVICPISDDTNSEDIEEEYILSNIIGLCSNQKIKRPLKTGKYHISFTIDITDLKINNKIGRIKNTLQIK